MAPDDENVEAPTATTPVVQTSRRRRFYPSTIVFTAALAAALLLANLMGDVALSPDRHWDGTIQLEDGVSSHLRHGWPLVYLWRKPSGLGKRASIRNYTLWGVHESVTRFRSGRLTIDVLVAVAILVGGGWLFNRWRRRRVRLWQFGIGELALAVAALGAVLGFVARERLRHARERAALDVIRREAQPGWQSMVEERIAVEPAGPTWLRDVVGDAAFAPADKVVAFHYISGNELRFAGRFPRLVAVSIRDSTSDAQLGNLEKCPRLEMLEIEKGVRRSGEGLIRIPRLRQLRGLFVAGAPFRGDGITGLPHLELLDVSSTAFDDEAAEALPALERLTDLRLHGTQVTDASLPVLRRCRALETLSLPDGMSAESVRTLRRELPNCRIYWPEK